MDNLSRTYSFNKDSSNAYKIIILGDSGVGKTSLKNVVISKGFNEYENSTLGFELSKLMVTIEDAKVELLIWDTCGQEVYKSMAPLFYRSCAIAFLVCALDKLVHNKVPQA